MALRRSMLKGMGLTDEQVDAVIDAHMETVDGLKEERDGYKANYEKAKAAQKELEALKANNSDDWKKKHDALQKEFDAYKNDVESEKTLTAKKKAYKDVLKDAGLSDKGVDKVLKYTNWDEVELDDKGKVTNAKNHIKTVKEEWAEYVTKTEQDGADTKNPNPSGGTKYSSKEEILNIKDTSQRQAAIAENRELFGI